MKVHVTKEKVSITESIVINEGEMQVNVCDFTLPQCFEGLVVTALFNNIPVPITGTRCYIPSLKSGSAVLGVYAYKEDSSGELQLMYSPKPASFYVNKGSYSDKVAVEEVPAISEFERYCASLNALTFPKTNVLDEVVIEEEPGEGKVYSAAALNSVLMEFGEAVYQTDRKVTQLDGATEKKSNKVQVINETSTENQYPSAAAVRRAINQQALRAEYALTEAEDRINLLYSNLAKNITDVRTTVQNIQNVQGNMANEHTAINNAVITLNQRVDNLYAADDALNEAIESNKTAIESVVGVTESISTSVEGVKDDLNAVRTLVNSGVTDNANAIKGRAEGVGQLKIDDVSPLSHFVEVTVEGDSAQNSTITCNGKNMLDFKGRTLAEFNLAVNPFTGNNLFLSVSGNGIYKNNGTYSFDESKQLLTVSCVNAWYGLGLDFKVSGNSKYAVSVKNVSKDFAVIVSYYDLNGEFISFASAVENSVITTPSNAEWMVLIFTGKVKGTEGSFLCPQLEKGGVITEYQPYFEVQSALPDELGEIHQFVSKGSGMTISSDNPEVNITCVYNKDTYKAYLKLVDAITALGGSVG